MTNHLMTIGTLQAIAPAKLVGPSNIAVIRLDDMPWASVLQPRLTAVDQPACDLCLPARGCYATVLTENGGSTGTPGSRRELCRGRIGGCMSSPGPVRHSVRRQEGRSSAAPAGHRGWRGSARSRE